MKSHFNILRPSQYRLFRTILILTFININICLFSQSLQFIKPYYWGYSGNMYYILNRDVVHEHISNNINLYGQPHNGAIVYMDEDKLLSFVADPFWNRIVYANYHANWIKSFGEYGTSNGQFNHPYSITADGYGNLYVADTYNSRVVKLEFNSGSNLIDENSFYTIGDGLLQQPYDLDVDDRGNANPSDDYIWVIDRGANQIIPFDINGYVTNNGPITHLYNASTNTYYWDLSGLCGIAVRKSAAQGYNSTSNRRLYLIDWKLRKLFFVEADALENGQGLIYKEKTFGSDVLLSGVESDYFGDVWVVDNTGDQVFKYTWDLQYLDLLYGLNKPTSIASVRKHHLNMAITERWTNDTGQRTYSHGANVTNVTINASTSIIDATLIFANYGRLNLDVAKDGELVNLLRYENIVPSGNFSISYYPYYTTPPYGPKPIEAGYYKLGGRLTSYDNSEVYDLFDQYFYFLPSASISGPSILLYKSYGTFTSSITGGSTSSTTYKWYKQYSGSSTWTLIGTSSSVTTRMITTPFTIKLEATRGEDVATETKFVSYEFGGLEKKEVEENQIPLNYSISDNYPNPFNPTTAISFGLPENSSVSLTIYNLLGQNVFKYERDAVQAGYKQFIWDGRDDHGYIMPAGVYLCRVYIKSNESDESIMHKTKMVLLK